MMTTADLKNRNLKTGIGYEKKDVDTFLEEIIASYEELYRSNIELNDRVNSLNEGLQHYKTIEASLQKTLILAERTAEETVNEAKEKAKQIEDEAKGNTGKIALEAKKELDAILAKTTELVQNYNDLKAKMKADLSKQMMDIDNSQISFDPSKYNTNVSFTATETPVTSTPVQSEVKTETVTPTPVQPEVKAETVTPTPVQPEVKAETFNSNPVQPEVKTETVTPTPVQPEVKVEPVKTAETENVVPQPAAAKFLRSQTPEPQVEPKVEPVMEIKEEPKAEEKSSVFNLNLGGGFATTTTTETETTTEKENKLGINLETSSTSEDTSYDDSDEDSYEFEVEDSAFRSKRNANGQMLIGNDDEESGFEFLSEL
ncbi:MAG: DivIVA domain-containing protein [Lachnospiraceae bacterium]|nr:DivIVA domain-containing protein [Lachnospiraceae bacterium]